MHHTQVYTTIIPRSIIKAQHRAKEEIEASIGAMVQLRQELVVVLAINQQHDRDAEDELSMRDGIEDVIRDVFPELNRFLRMAARAKPAALA